MATLLKRASLVTSFFNEGISCKLPARMADFLKK